LSDTEVRHQVVLDRLEGIMVDAERYTAEAFEAGDVDDATYWYVLAQSMRSTIVMLNTLDESP
jgi:hypothetical protein